MIYVIIWCVVILLYGYFYYLIEISKKIIFSEVLGVNEILIEFKGVKENRWGLCFGGNRKERVRNIFVRTIERKPEFWEKVERSQEQGRRANLL